MRPVHTSELRVGMVLARALTNERGDVMLQTGVELNARYIALLRVKGFGYVMIQDSDTDDIDIRPAVSSRVRSQLRENLGGAFNALEEVAAEMTGRPVDEIQQHLQGAWKPASQAARLEADIEALIEEALANPTIAGLNEVRSFDSYLFDHSIDSTVVALLLGRRLGHDRRELRLLAAGCLLHDIGMVFVDRAIFDKRGELTPEERARVQAHALLGYEALRKLRPEGALPENSLANQVAYQHHERQDGAGYPRGLRGTNRIARGGLQGRSPNQILLDAEITAVADVYDALGADRPYRAAVEPDRAMTTMRALAGPSLNREIVGELRLIVQLYPLGVPIVVLAGQYANYRGIVSRVRNNAPDKPVIRLLWDPKGDRISPIEVDLEREAVPIAVRRPEIGTSE